MNPTCSNGPFPTYASPSWGLAALLLVASGVVACAEPTKPTVATDTLITAMDLHAEQLHPKRQMTFNDQMEQIAQEAPGFAGFFLAPDGQINVKLKGEGRTSAVKGPLARYLLRGSAPDANTERMLAGMKVVPAEYDFVELATWYRELTPVFGSHGITMTDIDEVENRIVIGVETAMLVGDVRRAQQRTSVPSEAVVIKVVPAVALEADLQGNVRPVAAGVRIDPAGTNACTLAFNVRLYNDAVQYDGQRYFVTASHCTPLIWGATGARIGQHDESASNWIGTEVADPAPFTNSQNSTCPPGYDCRYSDAALVRYDSGINWTFGKIPTVGSTAPYSITGFKEIYNEDGYIDPSMGDNEPYYNGQSISKTGQATGKTAGIISSTCVDLAYPVGARWILCQFFGTYHSQGGDSGAPVYKMPAPSSPISPLLGVHWGAIEVEPGLIRKAFSPYYFVARELGDAMGLRLGAAISHCPGGAC